MNSINMNTIRTFVEPAVITASNYLGKAVTVIQANPTAAVAAIVIIAALIIGAICYKAYQLHKANQQPQQPQAKKVEVEVEFEKVKVEVEEVKDNGIKFPTAEERQKKQAEAKRQEELFNLIRK